MFTSITRLTSGQNVVFSVSTALHYWRGVFLCKPIHFAVAVYAAVIETIFDGLPLLSSQGRFKSILTRFVAAFAKIAQPWVSFSPFLVSLLKSFLILLVIVVGIPDSVVAAANVPFVVFLSDNITELFTPFAFSRSVFVQKFTALPGLVANCTALIANATRINTCPLLITLLAMSGMLLAFEVSVARSAQLFAVVRSFFSATSADNNALRSWHCCSFL